MKKNLPTMRFCTNGNSRKNFSLKPAEKIWFLLLIKLSQWNRLKDWLITYTWSRKEDRILTIAGLRKRRNSNNVPFILRLFNTRGKAQLLQSKIMENKLIDWKGAEERSRSNDRPIKILEKSKMLMWDFLPPWCRGRNLVWFLKSRWQTELFN